MLHQVLYPLRLTQQGKQRDTPGQSAGVSAFKEESVTLVQVAIVNREGQIYPPFMGWKVEDGHLPGMLVAFAGLQKYIPLRAIIGDQLVVAVEYTRQGCEIKGGTIKWIKP